MKEFTLVNPSIDSKNEFVAIFHLLGKERPMINFEVQIKRLVYFAKDQTHSKKTLD
jgi:hypothetical protein